MRSIFKNQRGGTMLEYLFLASSIFVIGVPAVMFLSIEVGTEMCEVAYDGFSSLADPAEVAQLVIDCTGYLF